MGKRQTKSPAGQARHLLSLIEAAGGRPIPFPAIEIEEFPERALPELENFDVAIFVSPTAAQCALKKRATWPANF